MLLSFDFFLSKIFDIGRSIDKAELPKALISCQYGVFKGGPCHGVGPNPRECVVSLHVITLWKEPRLIQVDTGKRQTHTAGCCVRGGHKWIIIIPN